MKKSMIFLLVVFILIAAFAAIENLIKDDENSKGLLASYRLDLSLIISPKPQLEIITPKSIIYSTTAILLDYTTKFVDTIWYNLDNGENITLNPPYPPIELIISEGSHTLYLYANNSRETSVKEVNFLIDLTPSEAPPSSPGGGGGDKRTEKKENETCQESWVCKNWSGCINLTQQRTCEDINYCSGAYKKTESKTCLPEEPKTPEIPQKEKSKKPFPQYLVLIILSPVLIIIIIFVIVLKRKKT